MLCEVDMNEYYETMKKNNICLKEKLNHFVPEEICELESLKLGDVPNAKTSIHPAQVESAKTVFNRLQELTGECAGTNPYQRVVISVYGGAGVGKTGMSALLTEFFHQAGIKAYNLSGDNYPRRFPKYNDAERLCLFRKAGLCGLIESNEYTEERFAVIQKLQQEDKDADEEYVSRYPWMKTYIQAGKERLKKYLGGYEEQEYETVNQIISAFKNGARYIWMKKMGREESELWYDKVDFSDVNILILEWTHGNNDLLEGIDIPVYLNSTPKETLEYRKKRNRDKNSDSPFVTMVLSIEQELLKSQVEKAKIIFLKEGRIVSHNEYSQMETS